MASIGQELYVENPTYVGMDRVGTRRRPPHGRKPHVCGDGPGDGFAGVERRKKTPRMWGWTAFRALGHETYSENPTYVGMDRLVKAPVLHKECKPHVCGDGPILDEQEVRLTQ